MSSRGLSSPSFPSCFAPSLPPRFSAKPDQRKPSGPDVRFGWSREEMREHLRQSGLPDQIHSAYKGYTGLTMEDFPTSPHLATSSYPDVTPDLVELRDEIIDELQETRGKRAFLDPLFQLQFLKLINTDFGTAAVWDTKYHPKFPGRNEQSEVQYARYDGRVTSANYVSNNIFGQVMAAIGYPLWFSRMGAKLDACGVGEIIFNHRMPPKQLRQFRDTPEDQRAIRSGYHDFRHRDPWRNSRLDPRQPYPETVLRRLEADSLRYGPDLNDFTKP